MLLCHNLEPPQSQSNIPTVTLILIATVQWLSALSGFLSIYLPVEILVSSLADTVTCDHRSLRHICRMAFLSLSLSPLSMTWCVWSCVSCSTSTSSPWLWSSAQTRLRLARQPANNINYRQTRLAALLVILMKRPAVQLSSLFLLYCALMDSKLNGNTFVPWHVRR